MLRKLFSRRTNHRAATSNSGESLIEAATNGDLDGVDQALAAGVDVNCGASNGATALMAAALNGHDAILQHLLSRGADLTVRDELGSTALHCACLHGTPKTVELLMAAGGNVTAHDKKGHPPFFDTVHLQNLPVLRLLTNKESVCLRNDEGATLLQVSAALGKFEVQRFLAESGADLETRNLGGETPLLSALSHSQAAAATYLLDRGANPHVMDATGASALHHAAWGGLVRLCERLISCGLDPNAADSSRQTPLHIAAAKGFPTIQQILINHGGSSMLKDDMGKTVGDLEQEAVGQRRMTEELRLLRALPAAISLTDMYQLSVLFNERANASGVEEENLSHQVRFVLDDLVHAYQTDPDRAGLNPAMVAPILEEVERIHSGEIF